MIFLSQAQIDALLLEDIQGGDLTTRALNIGHQHGYIEFSPSGRLHQRHFCRV